VPPAAGGVMVLVPRTVTKIMSPAWCAGSVTLSLVEVLAAPGLVIAIFSINSFILYTRILS
jgi:hypothetical protein